MKYHSELTNGTRFTVHALCTFIAAKCHLFLSSGFARRDRFLMLVCFFRLFSIINNFQHFSTIVSGFLNGTGMVGICFYWQQTKSRHTPVLSRLTDSKPTYWFVINHNSMTVNCRTREQTCGTNTMRSTHWQLLFLV